MNTIRFTWGSVMITEDSGSMDAARLLAWKKTKPRKRIRRLLKRMRGIYHAKRHKYYQENSDEGCIYSSKHTRKVDLDWQPGKKYKNGKQTLWNTHWPRIFKRDGYKVPPGYRKNTPINRIPDEIVNTIVHKTGGHKIRNFLYRMAYCASINVQPYNEMKQSPVWTKQETWDRINLEVNIVDRNIKKGLKPIWMMLPGKYTLASLRKAKENGYTTILIRRGRIPKKWVTAKTDAGHYVIDYWK